MSILKKTQLRNLAAVSAVVGLAVSPVMASAATDTAGTTVQATVGSTISMTSSGTVAISVTPTGSGVFSTASDSVSVSTNNATGYDLEIQSSDATNTLNHTNSVDTIVATSGTAAAPSALGTDTWGFAVAGSNGFGATYTTETNAAPDATTWAAVPTSAGTVIASNGGAVSGDATTVWYGVNASTSSPSGVYSDTVTYTATTN